MAEASEEVHIQATFYSDNERISVPSTPFSLPLTATRNDLSKLINEIITSSVDDPAPPNTAEFDFLINGSLLKTTLNQLMIDTLQLKTEAVVRIECVERNPPPSLDGEFPHNDWVSAVHCNKQYILSGSYDSSIHIWGHTGNCIAMATEHEREISSVAWIPKSHDGHMIFVSASHDQHARIWEFDELSQEINCVGVCKGHSQIIEAMDVCGDGERFCTGGVDKLLKVWSINRGTIDDGEDELGEESMKKPRLMEGGRKYVSRTPLVTFSGHTHPIICLKWRDVDRLLSAGFDHCIREWDVETGVNTNTLNGSKVFLTIDKSHDGHMIVSGHTDRHVRLWDNRISSSSGALVTQMLSSHKGWVKKVGVAPDNVHQLVSGSYDNTVKLWDTRSPTSPLYTITAHEDKVLSLDWSVPKLIASGGSDNILRTFTF